MDYETFKEKFVEDLQDRLYEQGAEVNISVHTVNKLNESYEAVTVTPEGSNIGVNVGIDKLYDAMENAPQIKPVEIKGMSEVMAEMMGVEQAEMMGLFPVAPEDEKIYVATVPDKVHGAGVLAYQNFMDQAAERAGGECLGLRWCDLDFENRIIDINHNLVHRRVDEEGGTLHINTPKTKAGERRIPMIEPVYEAFLEEYQIPTMKTVKE